MSNSWQRWAKAAFSDKSSARSSRAFFNCMHEDEREAEVSNTHAHYNYNPYKENKKESNCLYRWNAHSSSIYLKGSCVLFSVVQLFLFTTNKVTEIASPVKRMSQKWLRKISLVITLTCCSKSPDSSAAKGAIVSLLISCRETKCHWIYCTDSLKLLFTHSSCFWWRPFETETLWGKKLQLLSQIFLDIFNINKYKGECCYHEGLTSWMAVMTTCCTDSSKVMMIWMYSVKRMTNLSNTLGVRAGVIATVSWLQMYKATAVTDSPGRLPDELCLCQWLGRTIMKHYSLDGLKLKNMDELPPSVCSVQQICIGYLFVSILSTQTVRTLGNKVTYLVCVHIWQHSPERAALASPAPQGLNALPPVPDLAKGSLRSPALRPDGA